MRYAAIDIGSNAVRLLISEVEENEDRPKKLKLLRIPIRLGFDTFENGKISEARLANLERTIKVYKLMMEIYDVKHYRACATSAMRDAKNKDEILQRIKEDTGLVIDVISGDEEASIVYETHIAEILEPDHRYLYIDVGGGSTELTLFSKNKIKSAASFNVGTIRILGDQVDNTEWERMRKWIRQNVRQEEEVFGIGSGGNINTIFQLSRKRIGRPLSYDFIRDFCNEITDVSIEERVRLYSMKPDRADVIIPACKIFLTVMKWGKIKNIFVPQIGLVDGIVQMLVKEHQAVPK